ncbi:MAG: hypothetical protein EHM27_13760 [Deltaproteobacteria bacterium]|nr:MAG: hypothetical protein EHM27_13760 [Deltaproteobacteria bacterium]
MDMGQILTLAAHKYPEHTALICGEERFTYRAFSLRVNQLAHGLLRLGLKKGDKVAVLFYNSIPFVEAYFAAIKAGGVFVPVNFRFVGEEAAYILNNSDSRFFFFGDEFSGLVQTIRSSLPRVEFLITTGLPPDSKTRKYEDLLKGSPNSEPPVLLSEDDDCQIMYYLRNHGKTQRGRYHPPECIMEPFQYHPGKGRERKRNIPRRRPSLPHGGLEQPFHPARCPGRNEHPRQGVRCPPSPGDDFQGKSHGHIRRPGHVPLSPESSGQRKIRHPFRDQMHDRRFHPSRRDQGKALPVLPEYPGNLRCVWLHRMLP